MSTLVGFTLLYAATAAIGALLVGLIGTGASLVILPVLALSFPHTLDAGGDVALRLAVGTTLASMCAGAVSAALAQRRAGHVDAELLWLALPSYGVGALLGPWLAGTLPVAVLRGYLGVVLALIALLLLGEKWLRARAQPNTRDRRRDYRRHRLEMRLVLLLIGLAASIAGVASGLFAIPYLNARFALPLRTVIGTSTAAAAFYSAFGTLGYLSAGWAAPDLPDYALGYVYLPAFVLMALTAAACAPACVRLAGRARESWLKTLFAVLLLVAATAILSA